MWVAAPPVSEGLASALPAAAVVTALFVSQPGLQEQQVEVFRAPHWSLPQPCGNSQGEVE